jgi:hypothetical protein
VKFFSRADATPQDYCAGTAGKMILTASANGFRTKDVIHKRGDGKIPLPNFGRTGQIQTPAG